MKITMYELLGLVKDEPDRNIYVKYFDRVNKKEDVMWACKENIIYKLEQLVIELNDTAEILEEKKIPEKLNYQYRNLYGRLSQHKQSEIDIIDTLNGVIDYLKSKGK